MRSQQIKSFFLSAPPLRAMIEAILLGLAFVLATLWQWRGYRLGSDFGDVEIFFLVVPVPMLWYALRLCLSRPFLWRRGCFDTLMVALSGLSMIGLALALGHVLLLDQLLDALLATHHILSALVTLLLLDCGVFLFFRIVIRLWIFWNCLRHKQLLWTLTHAHVLVLGIGAGFLLIFMNLLLLFLTRKTTLQIIPVNIGLVALTFIGLLIVIPPSMLCSYLAVRGTIKRLKMLTDATGNLRRGSYALRIPVVGEDEVAQLQADFNAMAAELEHIMHELQVERDTVAKLLQERRELIANVSHELRTPVATLRGYLETTLMRWNDGPPPTMHHDLRVMEDETIRLQELVEDLFSLARVEASHPTLQYKPTDVGEVVRHIVEASAPLIWQASKIEVVADPTSSLPLVLVDPNRLEQVLHNLLHNAVRHTSPGGIVALVARTEADRMILQVKDTGEGIAPADLPHIWERFYQTDSSRMRKAGGAGLGLALVKEWVEAMGGAVAVESVLGEGSCFSICLQISSLPKTRYENKVTGGTRGSPCP